MYLNFSIVEQILIVMFVFDILQSGQASLISQQLYNKNIPYPVTCGARFCNNKLVTFQRPVHPAQSAPRSLSDVSPIFVSTLCRIVCRIIREQNGCCMEQQIFPSKSQNNGDVYNAHCYTMDFHSKIHGNTEKYITGLLELPSL